MHAFEQAVRLCVDGGQGAPLAVARLAGGKNNRVFRVDTPDAPLILKQYFHHPSDKRDRLRAEWRFLSYARARDVGCVPTPIACDMNEKVGLYSFVAGEKLTPDALTRKHVVAAVDFISAVNRAPVERAALDAGSEACFSVREHLDRIDFRVERLATLDPEAPDIEAVEIFVRDELATRWKEIKRDILEMCRDAGISDVARIPETEIVASPSDFGFHNALWAPGRGLSFLDFEYAGWDDPAKLVGDFFACPEIPVPPEHFELFVDGLCARLSLGGEANRRMRMMRDAYRIKWACIVLNDFLPLHNARRTFAQLEARSERCAVQFEKARILVARTRASV